MRGVGCKNVYIFLFFQNLYNVRHTHVFSGSFCVFCYDYDIRNTTLDQATGRSIHNMDIDNDINIPEIFQSLLDIANLDTNLGVPHNR